MTTMTILSQLYNLKFYAGLLNAKYKVKRAYTIDLNTTVLSTANISNSVTADSELASCTTGSLEASSISPLLMASAERAAEA